MTDGPEGKVKTIMTRIFLLVLALFAGPVAAQAATVGLNGTITNFTAPAGFTGGFGLNDDATAIAGYSTTDIGCPTACELTEFEFSLNGSKVIDDPAPGGDLTVDLSGPVSLDGSSDLGDVFGLTNVVISFGDFASGPGTFLVDADQGIGFASGTLGAIPLPAGLWLLIGGIAMTATLRTRRRRA